MLHLHVCRFDVTFACRCLLEMSRAGVDSSSASVVADAVHGHIIDHRLVVNVDVGDVNVIHRTVVEESPTAPVSAFIAGPKVSEAIIDATIKPDVWAPIACMPDISTAPPTPLPSRPQEARLGGHYPRPRHPVIAIRTISPVAGRPNIAVTGTGRLYVHRQHRRGKNQHNKKHAK